MTDRIMPQTLHHVAVERQYGVTIARPQVRRVDAHVFDDVFNELDEIVAVEQPAKLLLNLANVEYLYSTALSRLVRLLKNVKNYGGELRLCELQPGVVELMEITNLNKLFDIRKKERKAREGFW